MAHKHMWQTLGHDEDGIKWATCTSCGAYSKNSDIYMGGIKGLSSVSESNKKAKGKGVHVETDQDMDEDEDYPAMSFEDEHKDRRRPLD